MSLAKKSIVELRGIAQSLGIADVFQLDRVALTQKIEMHQRNGVDKAESASVQHHFVQHSGNAILTDEEVEAVLSPLKERGLQVRVDAGRWYFSRGKKNDEGSLNMPIRTIIQCAERVLA